MLTVKFTLHDPLGIILECFLFICPLSFELLFSKLIFKICDLLARFVDLLILLLDLAS